VIVAVFAESPLPGQCLPALIPYNDEAWLVKLYAAMLRDTLDGLENVPATHHVVVTNANDDGKRMLERNLPLPWRLVSEIQPSDALIIARANAPAAELELLFDLKTPFRVEGRSASGALWLAGGAVHAECTNLVTLPTAIVVEEQEDLDALCDELRSHHERAPRTALLAMSS
jgi:hypothetical protein